MFAGSQSTTCVMIGWAKVTVLRLPTSRAQYNVPLGGHNLNKARPTILDLQFPDEMRTGGGDARRRCVVGLDAVSSGLRCQIPRQQLLRPYNRGHPTGPRCRSQQPRYRRQHRARTHPALATRLRAAKVAGACAQRPSPRAAREAPNCRASAAHRAPPLSRCHRHTAPHCRRATRSLTPLHARCHRHTPPLSKTIVVA